MSDNTDPNGSVPEPQVASSTGCLIRLLWLFVGPVAFVLGVGLLASPGSSSSAVGHSLLWGASLSMVAIRYLDVTRFEGLRSDGKPSTLSDFRRYAVQVLLLAALVSGAAVLWRG